MLTSVKVKNRLNKFGENFQYNLHNVRINGETRGCSGFITNKENGVIVYISTEPVACLHNRLMYRYAKDEKDFSGCHNEWSNEDCFCNDVHSALQTTVKYQYALEHRI